MEGKLVFKSKMLRSPRKTFYVNLSNFVFARKTYIQTRNFALNLNKIQKRLVLQCFWYGIM